MSPYGHPNLARVLTSMHQDELRDDMAECRAGRSFGYSRLRLLAALVLITIGRRLLDWGERTRDPAVARAAFHRR